MAADSSSRPLGDLYDFRSGLSKPRSEFGSGYPFLTFKDVFYNFFVPEVLGDLVESSEEERQSCDIRRGDVFLTRTSETMDELGMSCVALRDFPEATFNGFTKRLRPKTVGDIVPEFAGYYFRSPSFRRDVTAMSSLSTRASLNNDMLCSLRMLLPSPETQRIIGESLKSLDDLIGLNRRTNHALEKMARAFFKAWFVDFEPVRAKSEGATAFPAMPQNVFAELPSRFTETEFGVVPEGWSLAVLGDVVQERKDRVKPSPETRSLPYVPIDCITGKSIWLEHSKSGEEAKSSLVSFDEDDILFGAMRPYFHKVCLAPFAGTTRTTVFILRPKVLRDLSFSLLLLSETATIDYATQHSVGSTIPYAKWDNSLATMPIVCPPPCLRECFDDIVRPMLELLKRPYFENRVLGAIRDALLPKLISGEIKLTENGEAQNGG